MKTSPKKQLDKNDAKAIGWGAVIALIAALGAFVVDISQMLGTSELAGSEWAFVIPVVTALGHAIQRWAKDNSTEYNKNLK